MVLRLFFVMPLAAVNIMERDVTKSPPDCKARCAKILLREHPSEQGSLNFVADTELRAGMVNDNHDDISLTGDGVHETRETAYIVQMPGFHPNSALHLRRAETIPQSPVRPRQRQRGN